MKQVLVRIVLVMMLVCPLFTQAQQDANSTASAVVPTVVNYSGTLTDLNGKPVTTITGVTYLLYKDETGGAPLWLEMQNITPDKTGHYTVVLGSTTAQGLPTDLFASGDARWLAVQPEGQAERPRVLLVSVPYALKAGDAQTVGGLPASAFMLANGEKSGAAGGSALPSAAPSAKNAPPPANPNVTGKGVVDFIPMWDTTSDIVDSVIFQKSSEIGINTTTPAATLDVNGKTDLRDTLTLFPKSTDPTLAINGTSFKIDQTGKVTFISGQTFPGAGTITGITTASGSGLSGGGTSGTLSLKVPSAGITNTMLQNSKVTFPVTAPLTGGGAVSLGGTATALALKPCAANQMYVSNGTTWSCAATGTGTITGVTAGTGLTGGGTSGKVTLNLDSTKVPLLASANKFSNTQAISANNSTQVVNVTQNGTGVGVNSTAAGGTGVTGSGSIGVNAVGTGGSGIGLQAGSSSGVGIFSSTATGVGIFSIAGTPNGVGSIEGFANSTATGASTPGVTGFATTAFGVGTKGLWSTASTEGKSTAQSGVWGDSSSGTGVTGTSDSSPGVYGASANFHGVAGFSNGAGAAGVNGQNLSTGYGILGQASGSAGQGVWGESFGTGFANGAGSDGVHGVSHSTAGSGVAGVNTATDATGVYGSDTNGYGFVTDSHVSQARTAGGWAKAMAFVDPANGNATNGIKWCFNSQIAGSQASTFPCGMGYTRVVNGAYLIDFGFQVSDRFVLVTPVYTGSTPTIGHTLTICYGPDGCLSHTANQVNVVVDNSSSAPDSAFYIVVF